MYTLGLNAAFHDGSACLVQDGVVIAAAEEQRFTRIMEATRPLPFPECDLPFHAIAYCMQQAGITLAQVAHVAYACEPAAPVRSASHAAPWQALAQACIRAAPHELQHHFRGARQEAPYRWHGVEHHRAREASAFLASPWDACAVLVMDGARTSYGVYADGSYRRIGQLDFPHSLALLYQDVAAHLGFVRACGQAKLMALASYGRPGFVAAFRDLVRYAGDGRVETCAADWRELLGPPRSPGGPLEQRHMDIAHSVQRVLEETTLDMVHWLHAQSGQAQLCMAGGVALNSTLNSALRARSPFTGIWAQPVAGNAGSALGAALLVDAEQGGSANAGHGRKWLMEHAFLGPQFDPQHIEALLKQSKLAYRRCEDIARDSAALLSQNKIIGWFQGRMEFGPRALGARSILASPADPAMQDRLNLIKERDEFRSFAPVVPEEEAADWFVNGAPSPFMAFADTVRPDVAHLLGAVRHVDGSARVQTINRHQHALFHALLKACGRMTGVPVLINTSFNTRGAPIVCTPREALESFCSTPLDALAIGPFLLEKSWLTAWRGSP